MLWTVAHVCCELRKGATVTCYEPVRAIYTKMTVIQPCVFWKYMRKYRTNSSFVKIRTTTVLIYPSGFEALFMHGFHLCSQFREAFFWFPSAQGRRNGRAGGSQKNAKSQGNAAPERQTTKIFQKSLVQKKRKFRTLKTNGLADGNQKHPSLIHISPSEEITYVRELFGWISG